MQQNKVIIYLAAILIRLYNVTYINNDIKLLINILFSRCRLFYTLLS